MRYLIYTISIFFVLIIGGFISFIRYIDNIKPLENISAQAIIVLTGERSRIEKAFELLEQKIGQRLLISGVHRSVNKEVLYQKIPIKSDLAMCCVDIGYEALDTAGNAREAYNWIKKNRYRDIIVVTSSYHMPRILFELRKIDFTINFIPYSITSYNFKTNIFMLDIKMIKKIFIEYLKMILLLSHNFLHNFII
ncbi:YdcF family protein [Candidatus Liberibacter americanus]|uniref:YdcF family protein n=1 Tax=Candidatus Liberibacter americanus TaxID=309868 RepID=UPI0002C5F742|nr:YdcF family protein [Candidatus Liberibacter americanus]EMS36618.1 hypothetical protein G653_00185 [Candidatus Liberibacter americanus PW_SP]